MDAPPETTAPASAPPSWVPSWLLGVAALVFGMVLVGGTVRLTRSGLSITEWKPVLGVVPPLDDEDWRAEFEKYRRTPEYRQVHRDITLDEFRFLYWMEWWHRLLGRLVGLVFGLPLLWLLVRRRLRGRLAWELVGILLLGGLQGWIGWFMVQSGLVDVPRVSPYRLTLHLLLALAIYLWLVRLAVRLGGLVRPTLPRTRATAALLAHALLVVASGALVAGNKAGYVMNTFPKMGGRWIPEGLWRLEPAWRNFFENAVCVQFVHRVLALLLVAAALAWWWPRRREGLMAHAPVVLVLVQATLGVSTLVLGVPIGLAVSHQACAVLVVTAWFVRRMAEGGAGSAASPLNPS